MVRSRNPAPKRSGRGVAVDSRRPARTPTPSPSPERTPIPTAAERSDSESDADSEQLRIRRRYPSAIFGSSDDSESDALYREAEMPSPPRGVPASETLVNTRVSGSAPAMPAIPQRRNTRRNRVQAEIKRLQRDDKMMSIPKIAFVRLVREIQQEVTDIPYKWSSEALHILQIASEEYLMYLYADAYLATALCRRVTLKPEDIRLVRRLRAPHCWNEPGNRH